MKRSLEGFDPWAGCYFGRTRADAPEIDGKIFIRQLEGNTSAVTMYR